MRRLVNAFRFAARDFSADDALTLAAALAFYAALSLAPFLLLLVWALGFLGHETGQAVIAQVQEQTGAGAGGAVKLILESARQPGVHTLAGIVTFVLLLFSATGVFVHLQHSLNRIWDVQARAGGLRAWLRKRLWSLLLMIIIGVLLLASVGLSAVAAAMFGSWHFVQIGISVVVYVVLFSVMFRFLPDARTEWRDVWLGTAVTAILFAAGNLLIGLYLGRSSVTSSYGAAGSLVALLLWVYYSAVILFFGAELTQAWVRASGRQIVPSEHGQPAEPECPPERRPERRPPDEPRGRPAPASGKAVSSQL
ncbi:MAG: YihY/virulence factor BrkB family protein [Planctomycetota bacterium]